MDLKRLKYFTTIIEQGSISKAARMLCIAQPPLSKRLQELEEEVGASLIARDGKKLVPTEAGQFLYQRACEILRTVEDTRRKTIEIATTERRELRVGVSYLFLRYCLPLVEALYLRNPRAEIAISVSDSSHLESLLQRGKIDVAFMQRPYDPESYDIVDFAPVGLKAAISCSLLSHPPSEPLRLDAIGHLPLILLKRVEGIGSFETILDYLRKAGVHPNVKMHVSDPTVAIEMLESGIEAVAFLPASEITQSRSGNFIVLDIHSSPLVFAPAAVRLSTNVDLPEVKEIITDWVRKNMPASQ